MTIPEPPQAPTARSDTTLNTASINEPAGRYVAWILLAFAVNLTITCVLIYGIGLSEEASFAVALVAVTVFNFFGLRSYVYRAQSGSLIEQLGKYVVTNFAHRLGEWLAFAAIERWTELPIFVSIPLVLGASTVLRFLIYQRFVFLNRPAGRDRRS